MTQPRRPAAYLCAAPGSPPGTLAREHQAVAEAARQRGWLPPPIYLDEGPAVAGRPGPALARLVAAVSAGRHDALLLGAPGVVTARGPELLMTLLQRCTQSGVRVELLPPPVPSAGGSAAGHHAEDRRASRPRPARGAWPAGQRGPRPGMISQ
jgi:hypothetical protein